ncbi:hypothetical protein LJJ44_02940 [Pseudomonas sp. B24_DOA]|nr:hypothetical protein LJJ44_02940 [Pseudomonas sp. B24_DOA]WKV90600.1 hypothetical protein LJU32_10970 [Pseudomonas sp. B21_DOA]
MKDKEQVSTSDVKSGEINVIESVTGFVELEITKGAGMPEKCKSDWFNFYITSSRTVVQALFGEDTGERVPSFMVLAKEKLKVATYEIKDPFEDGWRVYGIYGVGHPGNVGGDAFGKGKLKVDEISNSASGQSIKGSFEFIYTDIENVVVKVVAREFWAKNKGIDFGV